MTNYFHFLVLFAYPCDRERMSDLKFERNFLLHYHLLSTSQKKIQLKAVWLSLFLALSLWIMEQFWYVPETIQ